MPEYLIQFQTKHGIAAEKMKAGQTVFEKFIVESRNKIVLNFDELN